MINRSIDFSVNSPGGHYRESQPGTARSYQDWYWRYHLKSVPGVAEVAPVGGVVRQCRVNVDPNRLQAYGLSLNRVAKAGQ